MARRPDILQQYGMFHGRVTAFLIDNGATLAAYTLVGPHQAGLTAEYKLNLLVPAMGKRLVCRARVLRPGKILSAVTADVFSATNGTEKHYATALATIAIVDLAVPPVPKRA